MNENQQPWFCSWPVIIIAFIAFWPVGIALIILRNMNNKQSSFMASSAHKTYLIMGGVLAFLGLCVWFSGEEGTFLIGLFFIAGGISLIVYSSKLKKKSERNRQYIELIVNRNEESIDKIASICSISYEIAEKELQALINKNVLKNALINRNERTITLSRPQTNYNQPVPNILSQSVAAAAASAAAVSTQVSCSCPGCGAKVVLQRGAVINCDYCDTPITAK